jgi:hypothetical protein
MFALDKALSTSRTARQQHQPQAGWRVHQDCQALSISSRECVPFVLCYELGLTGTTLALLFVLRLLGYRMLVTI